MVVDNSHFVSILVTGRRVHIHQDMKSQQTDVLEYGNLEKSTCWSGNLQNIILISQAPSIDKKKKWTLLESMEELLFVMTIAYYHPYNSNLSMR